MTHVQNYRCNINLICSMCSKFTKETPRPLHPANIYLLKISNRNIRRKCEICSNLTIKIPKNVIALVLVSLLLTLKIFHTFFYCFYCWIEQVNVCWVNVLDMFKVDKRDTKTTSIKDLNVVFIPFTMNMHLYAGHNIPVDKCMFKMNCFLIDGNMISFWCVYCYLWTVICNFAHALQISYFF